MERLADNPTLCPARLRDTFRRDLATFPKLEVVENYINPATSATMSDYLPNTQWRAIKQPRLRDIVAFCLTRLGWSNEVELFKTCQSILWKGLVSRRLFSASARA